MKLTTELLMILQLQIYRQAVLIKNRTDQHSLRSGTLWHDACGFPVQLNTKTTARIN